MLQECRGSARRASGDVSVAQPARFSYSDARVSAVMMSYSGRSTARNTQTALFRRRGSRLTPIIHSYRVCHQQRRLRYHVGSDRQLIDPLPTAATDEECWSPPSKLQLAASLFPPHRPLPFTAPAPPRTRVLTTARRIGNSIAHARRRCVCVPQVRYEVGEPVRPPAAVACTALSDQPGNSTRTHWTQHTHVATQPRRHMAAAGGGGGV